MAGTTEVMDLIQVKLQQFLSENSIRQKLAILDELLRSLESSSTELQEDDIPNSVLQLSCSVYLQEQGNLKQCRRLEKLLYKLSSINQAKFSAIFSNEINELLRKDLDHLPNRLRTVVYLAEGSKLTRETFALSIDSLITYVAYACNEIILKAKEIQPENITMTAKLTLQLFQHFPEVCMRAVWGTENKGDLHSKFELMIKSVLKIIFQCADAIDTLLMASTALGMLINISQDLKLGCNTVTNLLILSGAIDEPKERQNITVYGLKVGNIFVDTSFLKCISESATNFTTLLLIRGLLNSGNIKLLAVSTTMIKKTKPEDSQLGRVLLLILLRLCKDLSNSNFHYQAVQTFAQWLQNTKEMLLEVKMDDHLPLFVSHSPVTDEILKFIWESINDPIDGVSYHVKNIFSLLLLVHSLECKLRQIPENDEFVRELINKTLMISWQSKGRYALLHCIIKQAGPKVVLNIDKTLPFALSRCLSINSLASISCDIYKTFLNDLQSEDIISSWATAWIDPIINGLFDDEDALLRHNMRIYWLPATLSIISNSLHQLLDASELRFNNMNSKCPSARATLRHIHAKVMIYNAAKALDIIHVTELPEELLDSSLQCWDDDIRMDAISLLCFCQKRVDGLTDMEIKFLRQYLPLNFNSDNAAFRQRLLASLKVLLERIRDSSLSMFKEYRLLRKRQLAGSDEFRILNQRIMTNIEVLDWLFNCSIECLNPDSSFQRSITGLKVCSLIFQIIASTWNPDKRKGQPPAAMAELINWAHRQQRLQFLSPRNLGILFHCFQSQHGEMESASKEILYKYVAWPIAIKTATDHEKFLAVLAINTYYLICSPKASDCNHGASLMALIVNRYLTNGFSMQLNENCQGFEILKIDGLSTVNEDASLQAMMVLHKLLDHQLTSAKQFLTFAIKETPIHGIITTIRRCLLECPNFIKSNKKSAVGNVKLASPLSFSIQEWRTALKKIIRLADELINYILFDILSDNDISELETSASFADMGKAINRIILSDTQNKLEDNSSSTAMYDLVISFCWLNLKEIGLLIGAIVDTVPLCTIKFEMDKSAKDSQGFLETEDVEKIGDMFIKLLTKCRHKGVIEGCSIGFVQVCTKLLCSSSSTYQDIPKLWLTQALSVITTDQMSSSFTKKSAGLPLLIQSIVSSEPQNAKKTLLRLSMKTLELVTRRPIGEEYDETTDLPQTHALNVMKVLYRDSSLGGDVLCYAADGVKCAIQGLRNPIWTIRNASMHLYGALVSRLFGQKRVRDEHSNYNNTQAAEFFSRYPSLKPFLLDELKLAFEDGEVRRTAWIHGGVYPALIILSKLQQDEEIDSTNPLQDFIPLLMKLLSAALLQLRDLAARSVAAFISKSKCLDTAIKLLRDINEMPSQNHVHGTLITVYHLAINILQLRDYSRISDSNVMTLYNEVLNHIRVLTSSLHCPVVQKAYLDLLWLFSKEIFKDSRLLYKLHENCWEMITNFNTNHSLKVGYPLYLKSVAKLLVNLSLVDLRKNDTLENNYLEIMIKSPHDDIRYSALTELASILSDDVYSNKNDTMINIMFNINQSILDRLPKENNLECLTAAFDMIYLMEIRGFNPAKAIGDIKMIWNFMERLITTSKSLSMCSMGLVTASIILREMILICYKRCNNSKSPIISQSDLAKCLHQWSTWITEKSQYEVPESYRIAAANSLFIVGPTATSILSEFVLLDEFSNISQEQRALCSVCSSCIMSGSRLLQDEQLSVRKPATSFVGKMIGSTIEPLHSTYALEILFEHFGKFFWQTDLMLQSLKLFLLGHKPISSVLAKLIQESENNLIFEPENPNLYAEESQLVILATKTLKVVAGQFNLLGNESANKSPIAKFKFWLEGLLDECLRSYEAIMSYLSHGCNASKEANYNYFGATGRQCVFLSFYRLLKTSIAILEIRKDLRYRIQCSEVFEELYHLPENIEVHPLLQAHLDELMDLAKPKREDSTAD